MGCDYYANKEGEFEMYITVENNDGTKIEKIITIEDLTPFAKIYFDVHEGISRGEPLI